MDRHASTVVAVDERTTSLDVRMDDDGGTVRTLDAEEIGAALAHAYAVTVQRSQGSTVGGPMLWRTAGAGNWPM